AGLFSGRKLSNFSIRSCGGIVCSGPNDSPGRTSGLFMQTLRICLGLVLAGAAFAQYPGLSLPPSGHNQKASVVQFIGPVRISIDYSSTAVHGPDGKDRRGQIWG